MEVNLSFSQRLKAFFTGKVSTKPQPQKIEEKNQTHTQKVTSKNQNTDSAVSLISLLQKHGRLIDFIFEDIDSYSDEEVGAGVRIVHEGCQKVLKEHITVTPIQKEKEETEITISEQVNPAKLKLTGNLNAQLPFKGILIHRGWEVTGINLPEILNKENSNIICPAEVDVK